MEGGRGESRRENRALPRPVLQLGRMWVAWGKGHRPPAPTAGSLSSRGSGAVSSGKTLFRTCSQISKIPERIRLFPSNRTESPRVFIGVQKHPTDKASFTVSGIQSSVTRFARSRERRRPTSCKQTGAGTDVRKSRARKAVIGTVSRVFSLKGRKDQLPTAPATDMLQKVGRRRGAARHLLEMYST